MTRAATFLSDTRATTEIREEKGIRDAIQMPWLTSFVLTDDSPELLLARFAHGRS